MDEQEFYRELGALCRCCDFHTYKLPQVEGVTLHQRQVIEAICKLCIEHLESIKHNP